MNPYLLWALVFGVQPVVYAHLLCRCARNKTINPGWRHAWFASLMTAAPVMLYSQVCEGKTRGHAHSPLLDVLAMPVVMLALSLLAFLPAVVVVTFHQRRFAGEHRRVGSARLKFMQRPSR